MDFTDILFASKLSAQQSSSGTALETVSITENGTTVAPEGVAYSAVDVDVPNTYTKDDAGKVVKVNTESEKYELTDQGSMNITTNGKHNTKYIKSINVNVLPVDNRWQEIGYSGEPPCIQEGINYAKEIETELPENIDNRRVLFLPSRDISQFPHTIGQKGMFEGWDGLIATGNLDCTNADGVFGNRLFMNCHALRDCNLINYLNSNDVVKSSFDYAFYDCYALQYIPAFMKTAAFKSTVANLRDTFAYCVSLTEGLDDCRNVWDFSSTYSTCTSLISAPNINMGNAKYITSMFYQCTHLQNVPVYNAPKVTDCVGMFSSCPSLTDESLNNILELCISMVKLTSNKSLSAKMGLSAAQIETCKTLSNYDAFVDAGWTAT